MQQLHRWQCQEQVSDRVITWSQSKILPLQNMRASRCPSSSAHSSHLQCLPAITSTCPALPVTAKNSHALAHDAPMPAYAHNTALQANT